MKNMKNPLVVCGVLLLGGVLIWMTLNMLPKATVDHPYGAQSVQLSDGNCLNVNGVRTCYARVRFNQASTTVCSTKTPSATTTLSRVVGTITTATSSATFFEWAKASSPDATTTSLGKTALAASAFGTFVASTTAGDYVGGNAFVDPTFVVAPNSYINLKFGGTLGSANTLVGFCDYVFIQNSN